MKKEQRISAGGYAFGTFQGVFTPSILTIIGVIMYLRFGWMLGHVGLFTSLVIVTIGSAITFLTGLSISALATNMRMKGGGAYFMLSRSLGAEAGAAFGIPLALTQTIGVAFYVSGFAEALVDSQLPFVAGWDPRVVGLVTLGILALVSTLSADLALKSQYFIMGAIAFSLVSFFVGGTPPDLPPPDAASMEPALGFWPVFAVFFPAVTGILSGVGMSGDLKDPGRSIPRGTLAAVVVSYAIYMAVPIVLYHFVSDAAVLRTDTMILQKCARWKFPILLGVWSATLSSAVGSFLCAPRVVQALARDRVLPAFIGCGRGATDEPRRAALLCAAVAAVCIWLGDINVIAPVLTLFYLSTYGLLNLSAAFEEVMSNPSWRPTFRVRPVFSFVGFVGCLGAMFMISPGWTFVALVCELAIYWWIKRRQLRAQWGDMRTGLVMAGVRWAFNRLQRGGSEERNWRPNLLVMTQLPIPNMPMLEFAREISGGRSLVTLASILPEGLGGTTREKELRDSVRRSAEKIGLSAYVRLLPSSGEYAGMAELVRTYGFGPIVPNTLMLGTPALRNMEAFAALLMLIVRQRRNAIVMDRDAEPAEKGYVDIWWRGQNANGALMLALGLLLERGERWRGASGIRANMIVKRRTPEEGRRVLGELLRRFRIHAVDRVLESDGRPFWETIRESSSDAAVSFIGLRRPEPDETPASYGAYLATLRDGVAGVPSPVFVLAAEDVDFRRIFA